VSKKVVLRKIAESHGISQESYILRSEKTISIMMTIAERKRILELSAQGMNAPEVARQLRCSVWTVRKWNQRFKKKAR